LCLTIFVLGPLALRLADFDWSERTWEMAKQVSFRIDQIAYGVLMARLYAGRHWLFRHPWPALVAGLLLIGAAWINQLPVPVNLVPALLFNAVIIGCALCLPAALRLRRAAWWFAVPVRWVSTRSYALYIVHLTILVDFAQGQLWATGRLSATAAAAVAIVLPFVLAEVSYRCLEGPILRRRPHQDLAPATITQSPLATVATG
jgi:peptidoglycan/LPS O-acetylase OafA/YrhL